MATFAQGDIDILRAVDRPDRYRELYVEQVGRHAELVAACRWLFEPWKPGQPNLNQVLDRIRAVIDAEDAQPPSDDAGSREQAAARLCATCKHREADHADDLGCLLDDGGKGCPCGMFRRTGGPEREGAGRDE